MMDQLIVQIVEIIQNEGGRIRMEYCKCGMFHLKFADLDDFVQAEKENVMSVWIPKFTHKITGDFKSYSDLSAPQGMENALNKFWQALEVIMFLAGAEHSARLLSFEIEKTRRRVNALEYVIIPEIQKNIKLISAKLDEQERAEKIVRMKIKDMITA